MDYNQLCMQCMKTKGEYEVCPYCGYVEGTPPKEVFHLYPRTVLSERYIIGKVIGFGGFGVTYIAWDKTLNISVAIKEFFPNGLVNRVPGEKEVAIYSGKREQQYINGLKRFLNEARHMALFNENPNIVNVLDFFEANNTAYIVMEYLDGVTLKEYLKSVGGVVEAEIAVNIMIPIVDALLEMHKKKIIHRDISPDNIFITVENKIKLLDFGTARFSSGTEEETREIELKPGYAPAEQYRQKSKQSAFTDVYALGATLYRMITGEVPEESIDRLVKDMLKRPSELGAELPLYIEKAIMKSMALKESIRFQNMNDLKKALLNDKTIDFPETEIKKRRRIRSIAAAAASVIFVGAGIAAFSVASAGTDDVFDIKDTSIEVWIPADSNVDANYTMFENAKVDFEEQNKSNKVEVILELDRLGTEEYEGLLEEAVKDRELPELYCNNNLLEYNGDGPVSLDLLINQLGTDDYYLFGSDYYKENFEEKGIVPLGLNMPLVYINTNVFNDMGITVPNDSTELKEFVEIINEFKAYNMPVYISENEYGPFLTSYGEDIDNISHNSEAMATLTSIHESSKDIELEEGLALFAKGEMGIFIGNISHLRQNESALAGALCVIPLPGRSNNFVYVSDIWCVSASSNINEQKASMKLLYSALKYNPQNELHLANEGAIPVNISVMQEFIKNHSLVAFLGEIADDFLYGECLNEEKTEELIKLMEEQ